MRKLKLDPESLRVESFAMPADARERGTVRANAYSEIYTCGVSCLAPCQHTREVPDCGWGTDFGCV